MKVAKERKEGRNEGKVGKRKNERKGKRWTYRSRKKNCISTNVFNEWKLNWYLCHLHTSTVQESTLTIPIIYSWYFVSEMVTITFVFELSLLQTWTIKWWSFKQRNLTVIIWWGTQNTELFNHNHNHSSLHIPEYKIKSFYSTLEMMGCLQFAQ